MYLEIFQTASAENGLGVTLTGICDTFSSLIWDVEYFSPGKFEVYVSANADTIALFRRGNIVGRSDDKRPTASLRACICGQMRRTATI